MELEGIMLSAISQSEKDKYHMISLTWNLRNKTRKEKKEKRKKREVKKHTLNYKEQADGYQKGGGWGDE